MSISSQVIIASLIMLGLALGLILFVVAYQHRVLTHEHQLKELDRQKQEELVQASIRSEEEERMRIASELHDDVGATLSSIRLMLHQAAKGAGANPAVQQVQCLLDDCIQKVRNLSHQLQPDTLRYLGIVKSLQSLVEILNKSGQLQVHFEEKQSWPALPPEYELALYRIVQELLNNIIKHSGARQVCIRMSQAGGLVQLGILHDGSGLSEATYHELLYKKGAIGLKNIENRLKLMNARISFPVSPDNRFTSSTLLSLKIPELKPQAHE